MSTETGLFGEVEIDEDYASFRRDGQGQFLPIIASEEEMINEAMIMAEIIESSGRRSLSFVELLADRPSFTPDCANPEVEMDYLQNSESNSEHVGGMRLYELMSLLDGKDHCFTCPIRQGCLAVSLTSEQLSTNRRTEPRLPKKPGEEESPNLVLSEYLLFGGYTPQERRIIFNHVTDILLLRNVWYESGEIGDWYNIVSKWKEMAIEQSAKNETKNHDQS